MIIGQRNTYHEVLDNSFLQYRRKLARCGIHGYNPQFDNLEQVALIKMRERVYS
jgi:hypothetical protein